MLNINNYMQFVFGVIETNSDWTIAQETTKEKHYILLPLDTVGVTFQKNRKPWRNDRQEQTWRSILWQFKEA